MTNTPTWPGEFGVPLNPDRHQWHWLQWHNESPEPRFYSPSMPGWPGFDRLIPPDGWRYLGPCLTSAEVAQIKHEESLRGWEEAISFALTSISHPIMEEVERILDAELIQRHGKGENVSEHLPTDPRIDVVARAIHEYDCEAANRERALDGLPPVERWADPWEHSSHYQLASLRRQAIRIIAVLNRMRQGVGT